MDKFTDDYDFETLTAPAIITGLPVMIALTVLGFSLDNILGFSVLGVSIVTFLLVPTSAAIRSRGKVVEAELFPDGMPTTDMLIAMPSGADEELRARRQLTSELSGITLLSFSQARHDRAKERGVIERSVGVLREKMRGSSFKLLRRELKSYGYWRNMYGLRWLGLCLSLVGFIAVCLFTVSSVPFNDTTTWTTNLIAVAAIISFVCFWLFNVRKEKVKRAASNYAKQFFLSLTILQ